MGAQKRRRNDEQEVDQSVKFIKVEPVSPKAKKPSRRTVQLKPFGKPCTKHAGCKSLPEVGRQSLRSQTSALSVKKLQKFIRSSVVCQKFDVETTRYARQNANEYYLTWNGESYNVCRSLYISTIGVTQWTIRNWLGENPNYKSKGNDTITETPLIEENIGEDSKIESKKVVKTQTPPKSKKTRKPKPPVVVKTSRTQRGKTPKKAVPVIHSMRPIRNKVKFDPKRFVAEVRQRFVSTIAADTKDFIESLGLRNSDGSLKHYNTL